MKVAVSIPDEVFEAADELARRLQKTRSQLYAEAVARYLRRHDAVAVTSAMDEVLQRVGEAPDDDLARRAGAATLDGVEW